MSTEEFIIIVYLIIEEIYPTIVSEPLRKRGFPPALTDIEIITMQIVGECLKMDTDKSIW
ncbi:IS982 family transposase, partial [Acinetobacter baumannii]